MPIYSAGRTIREFRKRRKITQEVLCEGLCEPPTLSKIESGRQNPTKKLFEALMSRLGIPVAAFNIPVTQAEFERSQIERLISSRVANFDCNIQDLLDDYENTGNGMDALEKQFFLFACAICENRNKNLETTSFDLLISAIRQTFPNYEIGTDFSNRFLTVFELMILNNIALCLYDNGSKKDAIDLLLRVEKQFYIQEIESEEFSKQYPAVVGNLVAWLSLDGKKDKARFLAKKGIDCCVKYGKLSLLPVLAYNLGFLDVEQGDEKSGIRLIQQAASLFRLMERFDSIELLKKDILESFGTKFLKKLKLELFVE